MRAWCRGLVVGSVFLMGMSSTHPRETRIGVRVHASETDTAAIRAARLAQNVAIVQHDLDRIAAFWTDDVVLTRGLGAVTLGRDAYRKLFERDSVMYQRLPEQIEASAAWPLAFESGSWIGRSVRSGKPMIFGRYSAQWLKRDGRWLIHSEVFVALGCAGDGCQWQTTFAN